MTCNPCRVYTPLEEKIMQEQLGKDDFKKGRERIYKILESFNTGRPEFDIERGKLFTESMKETEGEKLVLRWAKAMMHIAQNITVYIDDDNLIVGRAGRKGRYGILFPELDGNYLGEAVDKLPERDVSPFNIEPEDARIIKEEIAPYWKGKTFWEEIIATMPAETRRITYQPDNIFETRYICNETGSFRSSLQWVPDYEAVLKKGFKGLKEEAAAKLAEIDPENPYDIIDKKPFLEAMILICDAIVLWANRHADLAEVEAQTCKESRRREELLDIAKRCRRVPEYPADNFRDAVQSQWFVQMFSRLESKTSAIVSNGRMDQYFYPYYMADKEAGILTDAEATELLECMWVAMAQFIDLYLSPMGGTFNEGYSHWEAVTIGGQTPDGRDAVNELTYLLLKSKQEFPLNYPDLAARVHSRSPEKYIREVAKTIKEGSGYPKLINDEEIVPLLISKGATFEEAYDYAVSGCTEARMPNKDTYTATHSYVNIGSVLELALYNGRTFKTGEELIGLETGNPEEFATYEEFLAAFKEQLYHLLRHAFVQQAVIMEARPHHFATPLFSVMHKLCMQNCLDLQEKKIPGGMDSGYFEIIGYATAVDSLAAIKKLVYEDKKITMAELLQALKHNFEGYEPLRQMLLHAPKYGNNDTYADEIARQVDQMALDYTSRNSKKLGVQLDLRYVPFTAHIPYGKVVGATPNGRLAFRPLADGTSPSQGSDTEGPTAILMSNVAAKNIGYKERASRLLNITLSPATVAGEEGTKKLTSFIRTWCDLKLWHVQFNVVNKETLIAAKENPDQYRGLIVRIAGYSAYFTDLTKDLQDDLISRTEQETV